ncbi:MAG: hypothetical protein OXT06_12560 [Rhodospirillaceae bacterium]|nr:hypothetical protein [Rhodospirillaceae bacterium]MDD9913435.1 hypothetical protein [Rhodospirillaceae bacterium]MDD9928150.1 hypothetical protein [Rhodospirillaceae bacterium]
MQNIEFENLDLENGFEPMPGREGQIWHKVITDTLDHEAKTGQRTRILKIKEGFQTFGQHDHPYWEELLIFQGTLYDGEPADGETKLTAPAYARRAPGHMHGPARTDEVCCMIEFNYYNDPSSS